jgi:hypothetical protein
MTRSIVYLAAVAASGIATFSTPARAQSISTVGTLMTFGGGPIRNTNPIQLTDLCVHAVSTTTPGPLESKACNGSANQQWSAVYLGGQGYRFALESNPSLCLAVPSGYQGASSTPVTTMTCASGVAEETWIFGSGGQIAWAFIPTRCLDVLGANQSSGAEMDVTECNATTAQNFWPAGMAVSFFATNSSEANVLDVFADDDTPGQTPLDTYTYGSSNPAQKFTLTSSHQIVHTGRDGVTGCVDMLTFGGNGDGSPDNGNVRMNAAVVFHELVDRPPEPGRPRPQPRPGTQRGPRVSRHRRRQFQPGSRHRHLRLQRHHRADLGHRHRAVIPALIAAMRRVLSSMASSFWDIMTVLLEARADDDAASRPAVRSSTASAARS